MAFVTFDSYESVKIIKKEFKDWFFLVFLFNYPIFRKNEIRAQLLGNILVEHAPEPTNIRWDNLSVSWFKKYILWVQYNALFLIFLFILLIIYF
jgi:hypothetical protein